MYSLLKIGGSGYMVDEEGYYHEYVCDTVADINTLPTGVDMGQSKIKPRPGSTAVVTADSSVYVLANNRQWVLLLEGV